MPIGDDWQTSSAYDYIEELEPADLAWEFLRRNGDYQRDYTAAMNRYEDRADADEALAARWGLRFRHRPETDRHRGSDLLDSDGRSRNALADPDARRIRPRQISLPTES